MNDLIQTLAKKLETTALGSKAVALLVGLALAVTIGITAVVSRRPHYELGFSGLSDHEVAEVNKALAEAGIDFQTSQPPGPFSVWVDGDMRSAAYRAAYGNGALDKPLKGILSDGGVATVFQGSEERLQSVRKREWQEMEGMLEVLDFVVSARVRTSTSPSTPLSNRNPATTSASVTLRLAGQALTPAQSQTVAQLVSRGLGIPRERIIVSDQAGNRLWDGVEDDPMEERASDLLGHGERYDADATERANAVLERILGANKARITVRSEWNYDQSTTRIETPTGKPTLVSEHKDSSETPLQTGGIGAGLSANVPETAAGTPEVPVDPLVSKTTKEDKEYVAALTREERVRFVPTLERLSVALFLDQGIDAEVAPRLEEALKAAVGFVEERDTFRSVSLPFAAPPEASEEGAADEAPSEPNPLLEMLLRRGIEIAVSLVFVILLLRSLKGSKAAAEAGAPAAPEPEIDPELLARARIEELLASDPEQVGTILSSWAKGEHAVGAKS